MKDPEVILPAMMRCRPSSSNSAIPTDPNASISGLLIAATLIDFRFARSSLCAARRNRFASHSSIPNAFTMLLPVMVSCRMFWISASLSCPRRVVCRTRLPMRPRRRHHHRQKQQQHPRQLAAERDDHAHHEHECKRLLQELAQHPRHRGLHLLHIVDQGGKQRAGRVLLEERHRTSQHRVVQVVAQVRNHPEPRIVHQVSSKIIRQRLHKRRRNQGIRHHRPLVLEMRRVPGSGGRHCGGSTPRSRSENPSPAHPDAARYRRSA